MGSTAAKKQRSTRIQRWPNRSFFNPDTFIAAVGGALAGAIIGTALVLSYAAWRISYDYQIRPAANGWDAALLRGLGQPPPENAAWVLPATGFGLVAGVLIHCWHRRNHPSVPR